MRQPQQQHSGRFVAMLSQQCIRHACVRGYDMYVIKRFYAPDESNIIPQSSAGPGGTRPDLLVLRVGYDMYVCIGLLVADV
jgi:hypothetical protein